MVMQVYGGVQEKPAPKESRGSKKESSMSKTKITQQAEYTPTLPQKNRSLPVEFGGIPPTPFYLASVSAAHCQRIEGGILPAKYASSGLGIFKTSSLGWTFRKPFGLGGVRQLACCCLAASIPTFTAVQLHSSVSASRISPAPSAAEVREKIVPYQSLPATT